MPQPFLSYKQIELLNLLRDGELSGHDIREKMAVIDLSTDGPKFYQFMDRLESSKFVKGRYIKNNKQPRQRYYTITKKGVGAYNSAIESFEKLVANGKIVEGSVK